MKLTSTFLYYCHICFNFDNKRNTFIMKEFNILSNASSFIYNLFKMYAVLDSAYQINSMRSYFLKKICDLLSVAVTLTTHVSFSLHLKSRETVLFSWQHTASPARVRLIPPPSIYPRLCSLCLTSTQGGYPFTL